MVPKNEPVTALHLAGLSPSDRRLKLNIAPFTGSAVEVINQLCPVTYDWHEKASGRHCIGLIAQDVEEILPEAIVHVGENDLRFIDGSVMTGLLVKVAQEQQAMISELREQLEALQRKVSPV